MPRIIEIQTKELGKKCSRWGDGLKNLFDKNVSENIFWKRHLDQLIKSEDFDWDLIWEPEQEFDTKESDRVTTHQEDIKEYICKYIKTVKKT